MSTRIIITGGHHTSALPVIDELRARGEIEIFWIGHKYPPLEEKEIRALGIPFFELKAGKVYRNLNPLKMLRVPLGFAQAISLIIKLKPSVILSFGGYLAAPVVLAGWLMGVPSITHEQTVTTGYANKFISCFAKKILISWKQSAGSFPAAKVVYAGLPLRKEIFEVMSDKFELNKNLPTIYITAGKTGSKFLNEVVGGCLPELLEIANVIHQTGVHAAPERSLDGPGKYFARQFVQRDEIGEVFKKADMIVGRAGAHTVAEIVTFKKPAVLVPIPWVSHREQFKNAEIVRDYGLGEILEERNATPEALLATIRAVLENLKKYSPGKNSTPEGFVAADAAKIIADETLAAAKK